MKKILLPILAALPFCVSAQDFPGYRTGNYTGVNGVFFNPANIADSRYRWDVNLFSLGTSLGNNQASFKLKTIGDTFSDDSLIHKFTGRDAGGSSGFVSVDILGPSFMFNVGRKASLALTTRGRVLMNATDIDGKLVEKLIDDASHDVQLPYTISSDKNMRVNLNGWSEFGATYAQVIKDEGPHFFKGGITLKYLAGVANAYGNIDHFQGTINEEPITSEPYLQNTTGRFQLGLGGLNLGDFDVDELTSFRTGGIGADIGFVYEFRPDAGQHLMSNGKGRRDENKYKLRLGVSVLDLGNIKYKRDVNRSGSYELSITNSERFHFADLDGVELDSLNRFFATHQQYFSTVPGMNSGSYKVSLPTTLNIDADYHFHRGFYANLAAQFSLVNSTDKPYNSEYFTSVTITPRFEGRAVGVYVPLNYNKLTDFNAGFCLRVKSFFVGSGSVVTALFGNSKQADFYAGLRFGGLQKKSRG